MYQPTPLFVCYLALFQSHEPKDLYINNKRKVIQSKNDIQSYWIVA